MNAAAILMLALALAINAARAVLGGLFKKK